MAKQLIQKLITRSATESSEGVVRLASNLNDSDGVVTVPLIHDLLELVTGLTGLKFDPLVPYIQSTGLKRKNFMYINTEDHLVYRIKASHSSDSVDSTSFSSSIYDRVSLGGE